MRKNYFILKVLKMLVVLFFIPITTSAKMTTTLLTPEKSREILKYVSASYYSENAEEYYLISKAIANPFYLKQVDSSLLLEKIKLHSNDIDNKTDVINKLLVSTSGAIIEEGTGLRLVLLHDQITGEYILSFGSTFSGYIAKNGRNKQQINEQQKLKKIFAALHQFIGGLPVINYLISGESSIYQQAVDITRVIKIICGDNLTLTGSSLGGSLAIYAAAMNKLKAKGFATIPFNSNFLAKIENIAAIENNLENFITKGDFLTDISDTNTFWWAANGIRGATHIGSIFIMNPPNQQSGYIDIHTDSWYAIAKTAYPNPRYDAPTILVQNGQQISTKNFLKSELLRDFVLRNNHFETNSDNSSVEGCTDNFSNEPNLNGENSDSSLSSFGIPLLAVGVVSAAIVGIVAAQPTKKSMAEFLEGTLPR